MSEFGGLRKHEKTQHALVGLGSVALAAAVALRWPKFPERDNWEKRKKKLKRASHGIRLRLRLRVKNILKNWEKRRASHSIGVAAHLHGAELQPWPVGVQLGGLDEGEVHAQGAVHGWAVDAQEDAVGTAGPGGVAVAAVKALLPTEGK